MFGLYRLALALLVTMSHYGLVVRGFNPGQWAVVGFYALSGFLMSRQFKKLAPRGGNAAFYIDRSLRILPLYWCVITLAALLTTHPGSWTTYALNMALFPLNYYSLLAIPLIVSPAWSLACESHFYVLVPFLASTRTKILFLLMALSVALFALSPFLPNSTFWAYIGLPGILFTFLTGILLDRREGRILTCVYVAIAVLLLVFIGGKVAAKDWPTGIHINVCLGYLFALPLIGVLSRFSPKAKWDQICGLLSFPLFLVHGPVRLVCLSYFPRMGTVSTLLLAILVAGLFVILVEKPFDILRYRIRDVFSPATSRQSAGSSNKLDR